MKDQKELETTVKARLEEIKHVPPRDPHMASRGRAQFLGMAVSASELPRQKGWISIFRKERFAMNVLLSILVIAGLLFGGGATVRAAQDDLPNEPLYGLKIWAEDISLRFQNNGEDKVNRLMELAQIRIQEMERLADAGEPVPAQVRLRLEEHIRQALQICVNLDDPTLERALLQIRERLHQQDQNMAQLQLQTQEQLQLQTQEQSQLQSQEQQQLQIQEQLRLQEQEKLEEQIRLMLRERLRLVEEGLNDGETFRHQIQNNFQSGQDDETAPPVQNQDQNGQTNPDPGGNMNGSGGGGNGNDSGGGNSNDSGSGGDSSSGGGSNDNGSGGGGKP